MLKVAILSLALQALILISPCHAQQTNTEETRAQFVEKLLNAARKEVANETPYIMEYQVIPYPMGDVPPDTGVCTDLIIRAFRGAGIDFQQLVHQDRVKNPGRYPTSLWSVKTADRNIDHRRCPNLVAYLRKTAQELTKKTDAENLKTWQPGDIVFYVREGATHPWHVGLLSDKTDTDGMPYIIDSFPPQTTESHRLDHFAPIHSHFRVKPSGNN